MQIEGSTRDESLSAAGLLQGLPRLSQGCPRSLVGSGTCGLVPGSGCCRTLVASAVLAQFLRTCCQSLPSVSLLISRSRTDSAPVCASCWYKRPGKFTLSEGARNAALLNSRLLIQVRKLKTGWFGNFVVIFAPCSQRPGIDCSTGSR